MTLIETSSKVASAGIGNYVLGNLEHPNKGYGKLRMAILLDRSDEEEFYEYLNSSIEEDLIRKRLDRTTSNIWKRLRCDEAKFEFLTHNSDVSGSGFQLLI